MMERRSRCSLVPALTSLTEWLCVSDLGEIGETGIWRVYGRFHVTEQGDSFETE
jgi:hypothetical protein